MFDALTFGDLITNFTTGVGATYAAPILLGATFVVGGVVIRWFKRFI